MLALPFFNKILLKPADFFVQFITMEKKKQSFGSFLRSLREDKKLGVNQLAQYVGISGAEISRIERGERKKINPNLLQRLAPKLDVSYELLMQKAGYLPEQIKESPLEYDARTAKLAEKFSRLSPEEFSRIEKMIDSFLEKAGEASSDSDLI